MLQPAPDNSVVASLAARHLQHNLIALPPNLQLSHVERAIAASGVGLDHTIGERAWAFGDSVGQEDLKAFFLLTDRRLTGRQHIMSVTSTRRSQFHAELTDIVQVKWMSKTLRSDLQIQTRDKWIDATIIKFTPQLGRFLDDLLRVPPEHRVPPPQPLLSQSPDDPAGLASAMGRISHPQRAALLQIINRKVQGGLAEQQAADLAARVVLLDRALLWGRGMREGWWLSPLCAADLSQSFLRIFGQPSGYWPQGSLSTFDFDLRADRGVGKAVTSTVVGLAALGLFGVGWVSTPGSKPVTHLRITMCDTPYSSSFSILGSNDGSRMQPLPDLAPNLLQRILTILSENEVQLMFGRCVYGWEEPPETLAARSIEEIDQKFRAIDSPKGFGNE
jgi:hypothetical protein